MTSPAPLYALVGPTAVGKTDVSIDLAKKLGAEIIGCDSMQVYRQMPVLTQQPTAKQRASVPHHVVDYVDPSEFYSAGRYRRDALAAIADLQQRGKRILLVGGTGLYLKALADGLCDAPAVPAEIRERLWRAIEQHGNEAMHQRLQTIDPAAASAIHPNNARRIVRALEVYESTGRRLSAFWQAGGRDRVAIRAVAVTRDRTELYDRIHRRIDEMLEREGVLDEARRVMDLPLSRSAQQVHGLRFLAGFLRGELTREAMLEGWRQQVRNYAKRQLTWFRAQPHVRWLVAGSKDSSSIIATEALRLLEAADVS